MGELSDCERLSGVVFGMSLFSHGLLWCRVWFWRGGGIKGVSNQTPIRPVHSYSTTVGAILLLAFKFLEKDPRLGLSAQTRITKNHEESPKIFQSEMWQPWKDSAENAIAREKNEFCSILWTTSTKIRHHEDEWEDKVIQYLFCEM